jgi:hypothetical protein
VRANKARAAGYQLDGHCQNIAHSHRRGKAGERLEVRGATSAEGNFGRCAASTFLTPNL